MKIVCAFDSYKGSLSALEACTAAGEGLARLSPAPAVIACPLSDGGEGFAEAMRRAGGGTAAMVPVSGPRFAPVEAQLVFLDHGATAVVESAQACGLTLLPADRRDPRMTTSSGVGELLHAALAAGVRRIVVGLGGSATNDGGLGMLAALGWRFLDADGHPLPPVGASLASVWAIERGELPAGVEIVAACDVNNPLTGPRGATAVYGPQKGATAAMVAELDAGMARYARVSARALGRDWSEQPGAGAAGGLGFALLAYLGATFRPGAELAIELSRLDEHLRGADFCLTGEGCTDGQTAHGKLPAVVAAHCRAAGVPCIALSGALGTGWRDLYAQGMTAAFSISQRPQPLATAMRQTAEALADAAEAVGRIAGLR